MDSGSQDVPLADPSTPTKGETVLSMLTQINMVLLPACVGLSLIQHIYYTICTFIYVDAKPVDSTIKAAQKLNSRKNWGTRALLFSGIMTSMAVGKMSFAIFEEMDLARVKPIEYLCILLPVQVNLGILFGSILQYHTEKRAARKIATMKRHDAEIASSDEKQDLLSQA